MVRAKFFVDKIEQYYSTLGSARVGMRPVTGRKDANGSWAGPCLENQSFAKATPSGELWLMIDNPEAATQFELGKEYYVDFSPAT
jgi:hypothetical protein